jgi:hypothetical protein
MTTIVRIDWPNVNEFPRGVWRGVAQHELIRGATTRATGADHHFRGQSIADANLLADLERNVDGLPGVPSPSRAIDMLLVPRDLDEITRVSDPCL